jgi:phosphoglycolate phosphatase-like HAD superfamily hydrolase
MPRPLQLVIFDCDGVLVDSERLAVREEAAALAELGWPLSRAGDGAVRRHAPAPRPARRRRPVTDVTFARGCAGPPHVLLYQYNDT